MSGVSAPDYSPSASTIKVCRSSAAARFYAIEGLSRRGRNDARKC
jgi:hypothetical protein